MAENFIVARELINHLHSSQSPAILLKLDFFKAFDTVDWSFLLSLLQQRGFPNKLTTWIHTILSTASSAVLVNGMLGTTFKHRRGLRQGDPLSPFLFLLAADVLSRMIQRVAVTLQSSISSKFFEPFHLLQYADDTLVFAAADCRTLRTLKLTLNLFERCSGLSINCNKSAFLNLGPSSELSSFLEQLFGFTKGELPMNYLGLPLTIGKPPRASFQPLLDKLERKLAGWQGKLISRAGRLVLVSTVLSAIPSYLMSVFLLPTWLINLIDGHRRRFLWGTNELGKQRLSLLAWSKVCLPKRAGGLGVLDLKLQNSALLLRWLWKLYSDRTSLWSSLASALYSPARGCTSPLLWNKHGSFFWHDLLKLRYLFQFSTLASINSGTSVSFWYDNWGGQPLVNLLNGQPPAARPRISLRDAIPHLNSLLPLPRKLQDCLLLDSLPYVSSFPSCPDRISWIWNSKGSYSSATLYNVLALSGKVLSPLTAFWKYKVPPSLKFFLCLLANNKLLTQQQLARRNFTVDPHCYLCQQDVLEDALHVFFTCTYSARLWTRLHVPVHTLLVMDSLVDTLRALLLFLGSDQRKASLTASILWNTWLERNNRLFRGQCRSPEVLASWIMDEAQTFAREC